MKIEFDPAKSEKNLHERGLSFERVSEFDFDRAKITKDDRRDYGEERYRAIGRIGGEIVVVVFTLRNDAVRVISLRMANRTERKKYDQSHSQEED